MKILKAFKSLFARKKKRRNFQAAASSRLTADLLTQSRHITDTLRSDLRALRARSRAVVMNNPHAKRFIDMCADGIIGPSGFILQSKIKKKTSGSPDTTANNMIESGWRDFTKPENCGVTAQFSLNELSRTIVRTWATDGEVFIKLYRGTEHGKHGLQIQILDSDRVDEQLNKQLGGGGAIRLGIEYTSLGKPVAYYFLKSRNVYSTYEKKYDVVPADEIIHLFRPNFAEQTRGIPWVYAALLNLNNLGAFEEAAIIAARIGASQMGFIKAPDGGESLEYDGEDASGNPQIDAEPGAFPVLPQGYDISSWTPRFPDAAVGPFLQATLHSIAAGLGVSHHNLTGDMTSVNYSSARIAELGERDTWITLQNFVIEHLITKLYDQWLTMQALMQRMNIPLVALDKFKSVHWQGRRWAWVDPEKEINSKVTAITNKLTSRSRVVAADGADFEDILTELKQEDDLMKQLGIKEEPQQQEQQGGNNGEEETDDTGKTD